MVGGQYGHFLHGVASGDPLPNAIVLWTRLTPFRQNATDAYRVQWAVWEVGSVDEGSPKSTAAKGEAAAVEENDFTVKELKVRSVPRGMGRWGGLVGVKPTRWTSGRRCDQAFSMPTASRVAHPDHPRARLSYAVFSCANRGFGSFRAYAAALERSRELREPLDFWLHLGDYIYEYGDGYYPKPSETVVPGLQPRNDVVDLQEYRQRHAHYRLDPDLQRLSASAPMISIWDDHEVANDDFKDGAENHEEQQGAFEARKLAAIRAYHEWLPTRVEFDLANSSAAPWMRWRRFDFGSLATLLMLETRLVARTSQAEVTAQTVRSQIAGVLNGAWALSPSAWAGGRIEKKLLRVRSEVEAHRNSPNKRMLGDDQLAWISQQASSKGQWLLIGQPQVVQELMSPNFQAAIDKKRRQGDVATAEYWDAVVQNLTKRGRGYRNFTGPGVNTEALVSSSLRNAFLVDLAAGQFQIQLNFDSWTGYVAERRRLAEALRAAKGGIIYGGDSHNAWAGTLRAEDGASVAVDFDGMSVTSPGVESERPFLPPSLEAAAWQAANPDLTWADTSRRGFMLVKLTPDLHHLEYIAVDVTSPSQGIDEGSTCLAAVDVRDRELRMSACRALVAEPVPEAWPWLPMASLLASWASFCALGAFLGCLLSRCRILRPSSRPGLYEKHMDNDEVTPQRMGIDIG
ncbi:pld [Symbiodinium natans]|uniref:Pld protein n=1 Tax=Symbiodinium natans TaxID=878477 RepID=A0A812J6H0_9DINO|nr:pld [Symbiodinium natans]